MILSLLSWWYGSGFKKRVDIIRNRRLKTMDYFSLDLLVKTWFAPFRQISAGSVRGSFDIQIKAWFDKLLSRIIGGFMRTFLMIVGVVSLMIQMFLGLAELFVWIIFPLLPLCFFVIFIKEIL